MSLDYWRNENKDVYLSSERPGKYNIWIDTNNRTSMVDVTLKDLISLRQSIDGLLDNPIEGWISIPLAESIN